MDPATYESITRDELDVYMWGNNRGEKNRRSNFMVRLLTNYFRHSKQTAIDRFIDAEGEMHTAELENKGQAAEGEGDNGGRWLSRATREDIRGIVYHRFFTNLTYLVITLYMIVRPFYSPKSSAN